MSTAKLVADLKEVLSNYSIPSAVIAIPLQEGEFFLMLHSISVDDVSKLGELLLEHMPEERGMLN